MSKKKIRDLVQASHTAPAPSARFGDLLPEITEHTLKEFFDNYNLLGYDNGDAELACSIARYDPVHGKIEAYPLSFSGSNSPHVPNLLIFHENGRASLVDEETTKLRDKHMYSNFKRCPGDGSDDSYLFDNDSESEYSYAQLMGHSFAAAISRLYERYAEKDRISLIKHDKPTLILVGRPAGSAWAEAEQAYARILERYLPDYLPEYAARIRVLVLSESLAAMAGALGLNQESWKKVTQIFDLGSSTFDETTVIPKSDGSVQILENSFQFGGNELDKRMAAYGDYQYIRKYPAGEGYVIELHYGKIPKIRFIKEARIGDMGKNLESDEDMPLIFSYKVTGSTTQQKKAQYFRYEISKDTIESVLAGVSGIEGEQGKPLAQLQCKTEHLGMHTKETHNSWMSACEYIFTQFYQQTNKKMGGLPLDRRIILTGGVSNMPMVRELAKQCFKVEDLYPAKYPPSQIVSMGLVMVLSTEVRKKFLQKELEQTLLTDEKLGMPSAASLREFLVNEACEADIKYFKDAISDWVNGSEEKTLGDCFLCQEHKLDDPNPFYNPDYPVIDRACEKWFKEYEISDRINNLLKETFHSLFPTIREAFSVDTVIPDLSCVGKIKLSNDFEINPYMFFDKDNCPDDPYELSRKYTWQQRKEMLSIFHRHRDELVGGVYYDYGNGYAVVIGNKDQKRDTVPADYTHKVVSLKENYDTQITEAQASRIREKILERIKPQITEFLDQLTYYLNIS